ncbi:MAG TPA: helix-turn-helix domain-containing protein, partial [Streptosporangiaceae bacterium]|nr:helix-turn-helix domain-containing protein [Streptosporangiaceae bacterium]
MAGSSYGELVRRHRVAAGLTQEELAARSGLGVRTVSDIERGRIGRPHRSTVDLIARTLDRDDLAYDAIRASLLTKARTPGAAERTPDRDDHPGAPGLRPVLDIFPVAIGHYSDAELASLDVGTRVGRLVDMLAPFGGQHRPWRHPARDRGADAVQRRLREWVSPLLAEPSGQVDQQANPSAGSTVLYWAGHGWSDGTRSALAHAESPAVVGASGLEPQQLAQAIRARQAAVESRLEARDAGGWVMVIVETGHAAEICDAVMAALHGPDAPGRLLLVAVSDDGIEPGGRFVGVLANLLADTYRTERRILLRDLAAQLERLIGPRSVHQRALGEAAIVRTYPPAASWMLAPADTVRYLEDVLADLSPDERSHFVAKAQGAEQGELSWFFEGREIELARISAWLRQVSSGMLVVTGRAGSGKSALLGTVLVRSLPVLRDALARRGLAGHSGPGAAMPPESAFDAVIHLSGLHLAHAVKRTAGAAGIQPLPSLRDPEAGIASDLDFLARELSGRAEPFTVLADALDESLDPLDIARSLLARLASLSCVRILVGTRASTSEAPDAPAGDQDLIDALGATSYGTDAVIWVGRDRNAIRRYVTGRLRAARDYGVAGRAIPHMRDVIDSDIERAAAEIAHEDQEFLFARLAVYELIGDPRLLTQGLARSRGQLLGGTHQQLFGRALQRLASHDDHYPLLMRAISLARGRGLPEADGIWAAIAASLAPHAGTATSQDFNHAEAWATAVSGLLSQAAAYLTADTSAGRDESVKPGTVYRLAHRTFVEYFSRQSAPGQDGDPRRAAGALLDAAAAAASGPGCV